MISLHIAIDVLLLLLAFGNSLFFYATLLLNNNLDVCNLIKVNLPLNAFLGHVVIAGETF